ncbi:metallophosphoesterase family protein [Beduini massiliensis]|uniref:metallophosphoesterase family protein n=1 Tax=Beduini massiliensis TaxID=1585974 RepID=UPI00059AA7B5|nr:metallophosphoesterase family protein [Beduini massiliensis]
MKKIAVISDIHGNLEAIQTVLTDIKKRGISDIYCLGDLVTKGSHPNECIDLIKAHCQVVLRGNTDRFISDDHDESTLNDLAKKRIEWNRHLLTQENLLYLKSLPFSYEFYMSGQLVRLFHASPLKDDLAISHLDPLSVKRTQFEASPHTLSQNTADIVLFGHTHYQIMEKLYCRTLINVGSVGNSLDLIRDPVLDGKTEETVHAHYLILEGDLMPSDGAISFQFVSLPYAVHKELNDLEMNLEPEEYRLELEKGLYRDMSRLAGKIKH